MVLLQFSRLRCGRYDARCMAQLERAHHAEASMISFTEDIKLTIGIEEGGIFLFCELPATCLYCYKDARNPADGLQLIAVASKGVSLNALLSEGVKAAIIQRLEITHDAKVKAARASFKRPS